MEKIAKSKKEAKDEKVKEQKAEEQLLKSLDENPGSLEEKHQLLLRENRRLRKQIETLMREKENLQRDHNKSVLIQDKLQDVCREQQKIIKSVKNESLLKMREEEERRKESQNKFQLALNEITISLNKNADENDKLRLHNEDMTKKLKYLSDQYHTRELQLEKLNEQVQLERQLHDAKLSKFKVEAAMEKEILVKEKQVVMERLLQAQKNFKEMAEREVALKQQLTMYTEKYDVFQSSLQKSNDIFANYKQEIDKMSKHNTKLEKELIEWKIKWERSNATLINLATDKKERDDYAARCTKQVEQLQKLLRALQHERTHLYAVLRDNEIVVPERPPLPDEPEPMKLDVGYSADKEKMELMTRNCAELKETLACLQNQIKCMSIGKADGAAATGVATNAQALNEQQQSSYESCAQKKRQKSKRSKAIKLKSKDEETDIAANGIEVEQPSTSNTTTTNNTNNCSKKNTEKKRKSKLANTASNSESLKSGCNKTSKTDTTDLMPKTLEESLASAISVAVSEVTKEILNETAANSVETVEKPEVLLNGPKAISTNIDLATIIAAVLESEAQENAENAVVGNTVDDEQQKSAVSVVATVEPTVEPTANLEESTHNVQAPTALE